MRTISGTILTADDCPSVEKDYYQACVIRNYCNLCRIPGVLILMAGVVVDLLLFWVLRYSGRIFILWLLLCVCPLALVELGFHVTRLLAEHLYEILKGLGGDPHDTFSPYHRSTWHWRFDRTRDV